MGDVLYGFTDNDLAALKRMYQDYIGGRLTYVPSTEADQRAPVETYYGKILAVGSGSGAHGLAGGATGLAEIYDANGSDQSFTVNVYNATPSTLSINCPAALVRDPFTGIYIAMPFVSMPGGAGKFVTNICAGSGSGGACGFIVQYTNPDGTTTCAFNPNDCCGSGSGSGSGCTDIGIACCCGGVCIPNTLHVTITGDCTQLNGSYVLTNPGGGWASDGTKAYGTDAVTFTFGCQTSPTCNFSVEISLNSSGGIYFSTGAISSCSPFSASGGPSTITGLGPTENPCITESLSWTVTA